MKPVRIRFCKSNLANHSQPCRNRLTETGDLPVRIQAESCLGYCAPCVRGAFALVGGKLLKAKTPDELFDEIVRHLSASLSEPATRKEE